MIVSIFLFSALLQGRLIADRRIILHLEKTKSVNSANNGAFHGIYFA